jgi:hypothetical protein
MTTFRNRMPWAVWIFMAIWMTFLVLMTYVLFRDGPPDGYSWATMGTVLCVFWLVGIGASGWALSHRVLRVDVDALGGLEVTWYAPFRRTRRRVDARQVGPAVVVECRDSDGDPYYVCRVQLADGTALDLSEGHHRPSIEHTADRFNLSRHS